MVPQEDRARGLLLGLLIGDASGELLATDEGIVHGSCLGQLACFTVEGFIRGLIRFDDKGIGSPVNIAWRSWGRWAQGQGLDPVDFEPDDRPGGWLADVATLKVRRGSAPATVTALQTRQASMDEPLGNSFGHHALTRVAPVALFAARCGPDLASVARELAATTHGHPAAWEAAAAGALLLASALKADSVEAARTSARSVADSDGVRQLLDGLDDSPPASAAHSLVIAARTVAAGGGLPAILKTARSYGAGAATFAGALFGALNGVSALAAEVPVDRVELGWVADRLALDAIREQLESPGFMGYHGVTPTDPMWRVLYPPN